MRRYFPEPRHAGIFRRRIGIEAAGDGVRNGRLALFCQQCQELFLLGNQLVNLVSFAVEECRDCRLFFQRRKGPA
ncbi:hypothetical protein WL97_02370 [Burkholderia ubonensis]|nr:hypothetical protein WJ98_21130 [Burkholderia ubonensis]KWH12190.1 hypothetical protein WL97_02370 [Burkholderia ubonensis]